jgi:N4-gp56 family major capsid protein
MARNVYFQADRLTFWHNFEGEEGSSMPIIRDRSLEAEENKGADTLKKVMYLNLTGAGLTGDTTLLDGNEEKLAQRTLSFSTTRIKHAVRVGDLAELKSATYQRSIAEKLLARWLAGKLDDRKFNELTGAGSTTIPTKNKWAAGTAATRDQLQDTAAGGKLTWDEISRIKAYAQTELKMEPIRLENGQEIFGFALHPYAKLALKLDDTKYQQASREAREAGPQNPIFTGADLMVDGVVLYDSQRVPRSNNAHGSPIAVADNIFFGAQAMATGYLRLPVWREQEHSYGEEYGVAVIADVGEKLSVFDLNATETTGDATDDTAIGSMVVYTAAAAPTQP